MVDECVRQFGRIDFACNNAGMVTGAALTHEMDIDAFGRMIDVNTIGVGYRVLSLCATAFV
jgi:NAD(P)-dependent dehydrogenase (short-subunit alcohol dehydrogenase family)